jgi:crotonobetainyl-CoA:carnitine CoA-transferase CaiB-like acyl-CoA transferase
MDSLFSDLKVIDCASYFAAPMAATIMGDFGAKVIKVEPPEGDALYRSIHKRPGSMISDRDYAWDMGSRNKRGLSLDLKLEEEQAILHRLIETADVFICNTALGARKKLRIDYDTVAALNPRLIYVSFTAFGEDGAEANSPGFDITAFWSRSGILDLMREEDASPPPRPPAGMGDHTSAISLYAGIVTALYRRDRTGKGSLVRSSLMMNGAWVNSLVLQAKLYDSKFPPRLARREFANPLINSYRTRDGRWIVLMIINQAKLWPALLGVLGLKELAVDERFATQPARTENAEALIKLLDQAFNARDLEDLRPALEAAGVTFGVVSTVEESARDPQMVAAKALVPFADGSGLTVNSPFEIVGVEKVPPTRGPDIGEHNGEILAELNEPRSALPG